MPTDKEQTQRFYDEVINKGNMSAADELLADSFVEHEVFPGLTPDKQGVKDFFSLLRSAFPDLNVKIEDMLQDGDRVVIRSTMTGTHNGDFMGVPASGKPVNVQIIDIIRVTNGEATEHWGQMDAMALMHQIGAIPGQG